MVGSFCVEEGSNEAKIELQALLSQLTQKSLAFLNLLCSLPLCSTCFSHKRVLVCVYIINCSQFKTINIFTDDKSPDATVGVADRIEN